MIKSLNGTHETVDYTENSSIILYDNTDFEPYPTHWHTCIEIIMPVRNSFTVEYNKEECTFSEDEILFLCPGVLHTLPARKGQRYILQAELNLFNQINDLKEALTRFYPAVLITKKNMPDSYEQIHKLMCGIIQEYEASSSMYELSIYSKLLEIITLIGRSHSSMQPRFSTSRSKQKEYTEIFLNLCTYITEHCTEDLTLDEIANLSGFSKYHFSRLFKQYTNVSFYKYLNFRRIAHAEKLLINPDLSITDVAVSSGFSSMSSFIRMFKLVKGCTPSEFRSVYNL